MENETIFDNDTALIDWMHHNPGRVIAIKGFDPRFPDKWYWCWNGPSGQGLLTYNKAFTLRSAIEAAREAK